MCVCVCVCVCVYLNMPAEGAASGVYSQWRSSENVVEAALNLEKTVDRIPSLRRG